MNDPIAAHLSNVPGVQIVQGVGIDLFVRQQFLTSAECMRLIALIDVGRRPSTLLAPQHGPAAADRQFRTSESCDLDRFEPFVSAIDARVCDLFQIPPDCGETLQGQRYAVGQQFKAHHDWFDPDAPYWPEQSARGGQRTWTAMIYLDEPAGGGETWFSAAGLRVSPRAAMLLAWNNLDDRGQLNRQALHESLPVSAGVKTIVTKWFRQGNWC